MNIRRITDLLFRAATWAPLAGQALAGGRDRDAERQYAELGVLPDSAWESDEPCIDASPRPAVRFAPISGH
ncbi:hypothetical protein GCM10027298_36770 [Epidermidibacterium keratini]